MGRPLIQARVDEETMRAVVEAAAALGMDRSEFVRLAIVEKLYRLRLGG